MGPPRCRHLYTASSHARFGHTHRVRRYGALHDQEDLIHKATGWMLREMGKRVGITPLRAFLDEHATTMPRTMLRYALEKLDATEKLRYMAAGRKTQA